MRGAPHILLQSVYGLRIIPADAGSTAVSVHIPVFGQDHPRGCGEHQEIRLHVRNRQGSSPRMRGALADCLFGVFNKRIIPADAGSTVKERASREWKGDHPRGCGEHL